MKKRLLFILIVFIAWLPVFVIQKPVFMFYQHALSEACTFTDFLQVMLHGLKLDCTIAGYLTAIPLLLTLGEFYQFNLSSCIRQQNSLTAQFVSFSLSNLANIFYPPNFYNN